MAMMMKVYTVKSSRIQNLNVGMHLRKMEWKSSLPNPVPVQLHLNAVKFECIVFRPKVSFRINSTLTPLVDLLKKNKKNRL